MTDLVLPCQAAGGELRIEFTKTDDQFGHQIVLVAATGKQLVVMKSIEQLADGSAASPPIQEISLESRRSGNVALGVGMAGRNHWSAAFSANDSAGQLRFEFACRLNAASGPLVSNYQLTESWQSRCLDQQRCELVCGNHQLHITCDPATLIHCQKGIMALQTSQALENDAACPRTVQWSYAIEMV